MRFFLDTANVNEIREAASLGVIYGVTTNPTLVSKEGRDFKETIMEITSIVDGPISAEVVSLEAEGMVKEALEIAAWHPKIVIKIPIIWEGLKAVSQLSKKGIKTNVTLVFNPNQALLAARAGATYVSPFVGRFTDISQDGIALISDIAEIFSIHDIHTQIIAASIRTPMDVINAAKAGADIATVPYKVLQQMIKHPLTDIGVEKFLEDWKKVPKRA
ncbi:fructose-6-phosphate aldolase [Thermoanaerobacteraceae bacterium SP2]|nr:fructose-6-phosphate aldolase [Thermoanaerobacteraceae bacterium SP2]